MRAEYRKAANRLAKLLANADADPREDLDISENYEQFVLVKQHGHWFVMRDVAEPMSGYHEHGVGDSPWEAILDLHELGSKDGCPECIGAPTK